MSECISCNGTGSARGIVPCAACRGTGKSSDGIEAKIAYYAHVHGSPGNAVIQLTDVEAMMRELFHAMLDIHDLTESEELHFWNAMDADESATLERLAVRAIELGATLLTPEEKTLRDDVKARGGT